VKSRSPRLPSDPLLLDEGLGSKKVADALRGVGATVVLHRDHFAPGTPDDEWLRAAAAKGWIILSKDRAIRRRANERQAVTESAARLFVLTSANMTGEEMASAFVAALPRIAKACAAASGPMMKAVHRDGTLDDL
jgi:predicted nuclease of predicted toxin-antitoxin system